MRRPHEATYSIPSVTFDCILALEQKGFGSQLEGVFRQPGIKSEIDAAKNAYDNGINAKSLKIMKDPHGTACLLLAFFRDLPDSVVLDSNVKPLCDASSCVDFEHGIFLMKNIIQSIPIANKVLLKRFLYLLTKIVSHKEENKMTANNLARCVGLSIMHLPLTPVDPIETTGKIHKAVEFMIEHFHQIFSEIPDSFYNALQRQNSSTFIAPQLLAAVSNMQSTHATVHVSNRHRRSMSVDSGMAGIPHGVSTTNIHKNLPKKEETTVQTPTPNVSVPLKTLKPQLTQPQLAQVFFSSSPIKTPITEKRQNVPIVQKENHENPPNNNNTNNTNNNFLSPIKLNEKMEEYSPTPTPSNLGKRKERTESFLNLGVVELFEEQAKIKIILKEWEQNFQTKIGRKPNVEDKQNSEVSEFYEKYFQVKSFKKQKVENTTEK